MNNKIMKNVAVIMGCSIAAKILSYVWEATLAALFGASDQADALYMTTSIFNILYPILDLGIWKVFLPIYKKKLVEGNEEMTTQIANKTATLFFMLSFALVLFLIVFAKPLVYIVAPGFAIEKKLITIQYLRISAPTYLLMAFASIIGAMLQSRERFLGSQIREIGTHISKIVYIIICFRFFGIYAAVTAMIVGSIFRVLIQLPFINWKWRFKPDFHLRDKDIIPMLRGLPSVAVTAAIAHINGLIDKVVASGAESGAIACLNYGNRLMNVFSGMISSAISTATYPTMIQYIAEKKDEKLRSIIHKTILALAFFIIPISLFCILFSNELVKAAFQRGAFDASATMLSASVFVGYCIGMLFSGVATIITNVFYGFGDTKITMYISITNIGLNILFDLLFFKIWGISGLAVATSVSAIICLVIRLVYLKRFICLDYRLIIKECLKICIIAIVACCVSWIGFSKVIHINTLISLVLSLLISISIYFLLAKAFRIQTFSSILSTVEKKLKRKR